MNCSGLAPTYEDLKVDIERLVSMKAYRYKIPGFEKEDIAQEIRMVAFKALNSWDSTKNHSTPFHYIARCVDNYLINKRRDNDAVITNKNPTEKDLQRVELKKKIYYTQPLPQMDISINFAKSSPFEIHEQILRILPSSLHQSYHLLIENGEGAIPKQHFTKIRKYFIEYYFDKD